MYIYTHEQSQNSPTKIKYNRLTWQTKETKNKQKETKNYIDQNKTNFKKKLTKARCQLWNKAMKIKVTNMLKGKEKKKRKNIYAK